MTKWYLYREYNTDQNGEEYTCIRHYRGKLKNYDKERLSYVGEALLSEEYFITGCKTKYTEVIDLDQIELVYTADLKGYLAEVEGSHTSEFSYTLQQLLIKAKEGFMPYISFKNCKVRNKPVLKINGKKHKVKDGLDLQITTD